MSGHEAANIVGILLMVVLFVIGVGFTIPPVYYLWDKWDRYWNR